MQVPSRFGPILLGALFALLAGCGLDTEGAGGFELDDVNTPHSDPTSDADPGPTGDSPGDATAPGRDAGRVDAGRRDAGATTECLAGRYEGTYLCTASHANPVWGALTGNTISGTVRFALQETSKPGRFDVRDGTLAGASAPLFMIEGSIEGTFACGQALEASLDSARYSGLLLAETDFESPFRASYDVATSSFVDGNWQIENEAGVQCTGEWSATWVGP